MTGGIYGSLFGDFLAVFYFLAFQICGMVLTCTVFRSERKWIRVVLGSVAGTVLEMWLPVLFAFFLGFSLSAHLAALLLLLCATATVLTWKRPSWRPQLWRFSAFWRQERILWLPLLVWLVFAFLALHSFRFVNGELYSSQCTFGDMSMHFGFITSIAEQGIFPPQYSILPPERLSYPFLSDSISSGLYLFGASLRLSYLLPTLTAGAQVVFGAWIFLRHVLQDQKKTIVAFLLFFLNGGFGFAYFLGGVHEQPENFTRIFTAYYETPTNLLSQNIRWVNVLVDMLVPQHATLFGWAVLFPTLYLLYRAVFADKKRYFVPAALLAGALPMIHTHSFLALGVVCGVWLLFDLLQKLQLQHNPRTLRMGKIAVGVLIVLMAAAQYTIPVVFQRQDPVWFYLVLFVALLFVGLLLCLLYAACRKGFAKPLLSTWGVLLLLVSLLALPQLLFWTFSQAGVGGGFLRGYYNWGNLNDDYFWFYLVNLGVFALVVLPAFFSQNHRRFFFAAPAAVLWFMCEFLVFQPNTYDNNKLLYAAYFLLCPVVASYLVDAYRKLRGVPGRRVFAAALAVCCMLSAVLTILRESVAAYCIYGESQQDVAAFLCENTEPTDTVLTDMRHNNEVAALAGRNVVCGSSSYVYFHGLNYWDREADIRALYEFPAESAPLLQTYSVDYILVSSFERSSYAVDEAALRALYPCVYAKYDIQIYKVS